MEQWAYTNYDGQTVANAAQYGAHMRQANTEIMKANKIIADLRAQRDEYLVDIRTLNEVLRSYVNEGIIDIEDARRRRDKIRITKLAEF